MAKFRAEVTGVGEDVWSTNAVRFPTVEDATAYLRELAGRWYGMDCGRVVSDETPLREAFDPSDPAIVVNYRRAR